MGSVSFDGGSWGVVMVELSMCNRSLTAMRATIGASRLDVRAFAAVWQVYPSRLGLISEVRIG
jgi:hypothetical protein